ncbi:hypothetical protein A3H19_02575 [Candidatus Woesebacteria bacterium RIFCSPLOWO2_12_FULL_39_9]|nr:MAG: hypothetical protein A3H19_02575 [Candidatus Woesebacteria bacterium RIFCSPLOWO2_12_FULL_39_9]
MEPKLKPITFSESKLESPANLMDKSSGTILVPKIKLIESEGGNRQKTSQPKIPMTKRKKRIIKILSGVGVFLVIFLVVTGILFYRVYFQAMKTRKVAENLVAAGKEQNIGKIKTGIEETKKSVGDLKNSYKGISWLKFTPFIGGFISDGEHAINAANYGLEAGDTVVQIIEPYADIIGFDGGDQAVSGQETAQDRLEFVIKTIPDVIPRAGVLVEKTIKVKTELENIDPARYPETLAGHEVRSVIEKGLDAVETGSKLIENGKPLLEASPYLLGIKNDRKYLVLFQNDKELRPTGGFITAYTLATVRNGKFEPGASSDIYDLDKGYKPIITAPDPFVKYLKGPYSLSKRVWLRDLNWSPDFSESMKVFLGEVEKVNIKNVDGIIAVDTQLLVNLLDVIGPIGVSGYGEFSTKIVPECECPQVIYELESFADVEGPIVWSENEPGKIVFAPANYDNRKKIIGPLMNSVLENTLGQPKEKIPALFEAIFKSLSEKHVLFYLVDKNTQKSVETFGIAGTLDEFEGDYLHINDANLGGRKSNLYVTQEVNQEIKVNKDKSIEKTLTITYKNPEDYDGWLNSVLPNWVRIYVPKGSQLISFDGAEEKIDPYDDLGKTVFAGFFKLRPKGVVKLTVRYKLPLKTSNEYKLLIQKQPGKDKILHEISFGKKKEDFYLEADKEFKFKVK